MANGLEENAILSLIKSKLNSERIKLWIPPYSDEEGNRADFTSDLVQRYTTDLKLPEEVVSAAIENLRVTSIARLGARNYFQETGVAALKVKATVQGSAERNTKVTLTINTKLDVSGQELRRLVAAQLKIDPTMVKLISCGSIVSDDCTLQEQGMTPAASIMAILLCQLPSVTAAAEDQFNQNQSALKITKEDAELLATNAEVTDNDDNSLMTIADQNGRSLDIPKAQKKALSMAMILNEKGKSAMKRKEYSRALLLFLEADKEFKKCSTDLLGAVDNYALVCLDITWCYLCLRSIEELPDAESRLKTCEECLQKSYGLNLERLKNLKGSSGGEATIMVRLNLMKGISAYYKRQWNVAARIFGQVEQELKILKVDDSKLSQVMTLGYTAAEARLALRCSSADVEMAVQFLISKKEEQQKQIAIEKKNMKSRALGKTAKGDWINYDFYNALLAMGTPAAAAKAALAQSNNHVSMAVQIIHDHPELLKLKDDLVISDEMVAQVVSCGFDMEVARKCLAKHKGNVVAAIDELVTSGGIFLEVVDPTAASGSASTSEEAAAAVVEAHRKYREEKQKAHDALDRLKSDITDDDDAYLDLILDEEEEFLKEYKQLLTFAQR